MNDLLKAKELLKDDITCVLIKDEITYTSKENGIKPLMKAINANTDLKDFSCADKVIGKAQAFLCIYAGIKEVYGKTISKQAINILEKYHIPYEYENLVDYILNNNGDDMCPMEKTVIDIDEPGLAYKALKDKVAMLMANKN